MNFTDNTPGCIKRINVIPTLGGVSPQLFVINANCALNILWAAINVGGLFVPLFSIYLNWHSKTILN